MKMREEGWSHAHPRLCVITCELARMERTEREHVGELLQAGTRLERGMQTACILCAYF